MSGLTFPLSFGLTRVDTPSFSLTAISEAFGLIFNSGSVLNSSAFFAPLTHSLILTRGTGDPTYTRATTAYATDFEGLLKQVPSGAARFSGARFVRNLITAGSSAQPNGTGWTNDGVASSTNTITANAGVASHWCYYTTAATPAAGLFQYQCRAKAGTASWIGISAGNGAATKGAFFNLATGAIGSTAGAGVTACISVVTDSAGYYLCSVNIPNTQPSFIAVEPHTADAQALSWNAAGTETVLVKDLQITSKVGMASVVPDEYVSFGVLSAPYHGAGVDGCKYFATENGNTVASNVVTEATGAAISTATLLGYLAEGARTNRCLHSQAFSNAAWVSGGGGIAVADNSTAAPDGTTTADTLTASGANGTLIQDLGVVASAAKAGGLWLKRKTGTGNIDITLDGGLTWTTKAITTSWVRYEIAQTLADEDFGIRIVTSGDEVYAWQGQVETAAFLSSDIATTTLVVARNADVLTYPNAGNISATAGTYYAELSGVSALSAQTVEIISTKTGGDGVPMLSASGVLKLYDGAFRTLVSAITFDGTPKKIATKYTGATCGGAVSGVLATPAAFTNPMPMTTDLIILGRSTGGNSFANTKNCRIWTSALTDAQLVTITTP